MLGNYNRIFAQDSPRSIIQLSKLLGNYNLAVSGSCCCLIIQLSKLLGNYNPRRSRVGKHCIIQLSKLLGNYNPTCVIWLCLKLYNLKDCSLFVRFIYSSYSNQTIHSYPRYSTARAFLSSRLQRCIGINTHIQMTQNTASVKCTHKSAEKHRNTQHRAVIVTHAINRGEKVKICAQIA